MRSLIANPFFIACLSAGFVFSQKIHADTLDNDYHTAVTDAAVTEQDEIVNNLNAVSRENEQLKWNNEATKLLVVTWKAKGAYENFIKPYPATSKNEDYVVWVTLVPQVQNFCKNFMAEQSPSKEDLDRRLKQYLGLNHTWTYDVFVELWVSPDDLFRPCVDPETHDSACNLDFAKESPRIRNIADYKEFYKSLYYKSFRSGTGAPWTGLGYTYDWAVPGSEVGASEFILVPDAAYEVNRVVPTNEYCGQSEI